VRSRRARVLADVRERLLDDPKGREVEALRELARLASDRQADLEARRARLLEEPVEVGEARLRRALRGVVLVDAQELQRAVHLGHRLTAEIGDAVGRVGHAIVGDRRAERLRLDDDEAHVVGHDVVQLLRDPYALL
jgi:hypothetical protein